MTADRHCGLTPAEGRSLLAMVRQNMHRNYVSHQPAVKFSPHRAGIKALHNGWAFTPRPTPIADKHTTIVLAGAA